MGSNVHNGERALTEQEVLKIHTNIYAGMYDDREINDLFQTIRLQKIILRSMFNLFHEEPLKLNVTPDTIRLATLREWKYLSGMEDR